MLTDLAVLAAADEPRRGWGGPLAILVAFALLGLIHVVVERRKNMIANPSPTPPRERHAGVNAQVGAGSDPDDPDCDPGWWGRIVEENGVRVRKFRQVWRTGSSQLPDEPEDDELDLLIEDSPGAGPEEDLTLHEWLAEHDSGPAGTNALIRRAMHRYGKSESTVKRALREVRAGGAAAA